MPAGRRKIIARPLQPFSKPDVCSLSYRCFEPKQKMNNPFSTNSGVIA